MSDTATNHKPSAGPAGNLTVGGQFGCNTKSAQAAATAHAAIITTATTLSTPYGFATGAQGDNLVTLVNQMRAALVANGIMV